MGQFRNRGSKIIYYQGHEGPRRLYVSRVSLVRLRVLDGEGFANWSTTGHVFGARWRGIQVILPSLVWRRIWRTRSFCDGGEENLKQMTPSPVATPAVSGQAKEKAAMDPGFRGYQSSRKRAPCARGAGRGLSSRTAGTAPPGSDHQ